MLRVVLAGCLPLAVTVAGAYAGTVLGTRTSGNTTFTWYDDGGAWVTYPCAQKVGETCWDRRDRWRADGNKVCLTFMKYHAGKETCV
jgi:hypothetical protein